MKKALFSIAAFVLIVISSSSCKKETVTNTVTDHDTTVVFDTVKALKLSKTQILANHTWEVEETYQDLSSSIFYYVRDSINTIGADEDTIRFTFTTAGAGTYRDETGYVWNTTWSFTTPDDNNLILQLTGGPTFNWTLLNICDSAVFETIPLSNGDLVTAKLIPVP